MAMAASILSNVGKFATSSLDDDLDRVATFFALPKSSRLMARLIGTTPSSLSRAKTGQTTSLRAAKHIAVLAAFTLELEKHVRQSADLPAEADPANMHRWLLSGRMIVDGFPRIPFEVLSNYQLAAEALTAVRLERRDAKSAQAEAAESPAEAPSGQD
jgi:hypothetical protein